MTTKVKWVTKNQHSLVFFLTVTSHEPGQHSTELCGYWVLVLQENGSLLQQDSAGKECDINYNHKTCSKKCSGPNVKGMSAVSLGDTQSARTCYILLQGSPWLLTCQVFPETGYRMVWHETFDLILSGRWAGRSYYFTASQKQKSLTAQEH